MSEPTALLVFTDGRKECLERTIPSALENLKGDLAFKIIHDDSVNPDYKRWLHREFGPLGFRVIGSPTYKRGFGGSIAFMWETCDFALPPEIQWCFWLEDDFTFNHPVDLEAMQRVLQDAPHLAQMALRRQPWNEEERAAGGQIERFPVRDFLEHSNHHGDRWLEHRRWFTTNPCMIRRSLLKRGWPNIPQSEGNFTIQLLQENPETRFGYWGAYDSGEWVTHIGTERVGMGY